MMSGVRASSMKMLSASSTRAKLCSRCTLGSIGWAKPPVCVHGGQNGQRPVVHDDAASQLHVERPHLQLPVGDDADQAERLGQQLVERLAAAGPAAQVQAGLARVGVGEALVLFLPVADLVDVEGR